MTVVVTGAAGFVGRALMAQLRAAGYPAIGVSRREQPGVLRLDDYAESPKGEVLVHLAEDSVRSRVNAAGDEYALQTLSTLRALSQRGYRRIVYASSAVIYGDFSTHPHRTDDPVRIVDVYTRVKAESERVVLEQHQGGAIARLANTYGPGMARENVLSTIMQQLGRTGPVRVMDDSPVRDFVWIADVADALARMATSSATGIFNIGTGIGVSVGQLAAAALECSGEPSRVVESTSTPKRLSHLVVDPSSACRTFGWRATTSLAEGLAQLIQTYGHNRP